MDLSLSGEIPLTSWFAKKPAKPREQRPGKRRQGEPDSSPPVKKSKVVDVDENAPSILKRASIMNYIQSRPSIHAHSPRTPQLKALSRSKAGLPTPPDTSRPVVKPQRTLPALFGTHSDRNLEDEAIFTSPPESRQSKTVTPAKSTASSDVIEISDDDSENSCDNLEIPSSQSQEMGGHPIPSSSDFVGSSQSQLLDVWENPSPRKNKRLRSPIAVEPTLELIPSSQSQEWDLGTTYYRTEARFDSKRVVARPLNKVLFGSFADSDVSVPDGRLDDICAKLDAMDSTEDGTQDAHSFEDDHDFEPSQLEEYGDDEILNFSQPELDLIADHAPNDDTSPSPSSRSPQQVADYQESLPAESLPEEVKDFLDMFGSVEGSYPPDFPESLKD